jgi:hypothetical protein
MDRQAVDLHGRIASSNAETGKPVTCPSSPFRKIFCFAIRPNQLLDFRHPVPHRGALRDRHGLGGGMRWTLTVLLTRASDADRSAYGSSSVSQYK